MIANTLLHAAYIASLHTHDHDYNHKYKYGLITDKLYEIV